MKFYNFGKHFSSIFLFLSSVTSLHAAVKKRQEGNLGKIGKQNRLLFFSVLAQDIMSMRQLVPFPLKMLDGQQKTQGTILLHEFSQPLCARLVSARKILRIFFSCNLLQFCFFFLCSPVLNKNYQKNPVGSQEVTMYRALTRVCIVLFLVMILFIHIDTPKTNSLPNFCFYFFLLNYLRKKNYWENYYDFEFTLEKSVLNFP